MCPVCGEPMVVFELEGIEIDRCLACGGTWLDPHELEHIAARAGAAPGKLAHAIKHARGEKHGKHRCPRCRGKLRIVAVEGIEIDRCPRGHGLWLDRGEMETLVDKFHDGESGAVARFFADLYAKELQKGA